MLLLLQTVVCFLALRIQEYNHHEELLNQQLRSRLFENSSVHYWSERCVARTYGPMKWPLAQFNDQCANVAPVYPRGFEPRLFVVKC